MIEAGLEKMVDGVLQKGCELLEVSASLREDKVELEEKLLSQLLELQRRGRQCLISRKRWLRLSRSSLLFESRSIWAVQRSRHSSTKSACCEVT